MWKQGDNDCDRQRKEEKEVEKKMKARESVTDGQSSAFRRPHYDLYICVKSLCGSSNVVHSFNSS